MSAYTEKMSVKIRFFAIGRGFEKSVAEVFN